MRRATRIPCGATGHGGDVSTQLTHWPRVTDTVLEVGGRRLRVLRADSRHPDGGEPQLLDLMAADFADDTDPEGRRRAMLAPCGRRSGRSRCRPWCSVARRTRLFEQWQAAPAKAG